MWLDLSIDNQSFRKNTGVLFSPCKGLGNEHVWHCVILDISYIITLKPLFCIQNTIFPSFLGMKELCYLKKIFFFEKIFRAVLLFWEIA